MFLFSWCMILCFIILMRKKNQIKKIQAFLSILGYFNAKFILQHHVFALQINISPACLELIKWKILTDRGTAVNSFILMVMMNCFCGMVDRQKAFSLISSRDHCQRSSTSSISDTPQAGFELAQNLSSDFVEWSCAVVITTTPRRH